MDRLQDDFGNGLQVITLNANKEGREAFRAGAFQGHPAFVLLEPDGTEVWRGLGILDYSAMANTVEQALER